MMARFWFKLRRNITMDGDLQLARLELEAFVEDLQDCVSLDLPDFPSSKSHVRDGQQGYYAEADIVLLPVLIRRLTFIQRIYVISYNTPYIRDLLSDDATVITNCSHHDHLMIEVIPHYPLFEFAEVVARKAKSPDRVRDQLTRLLAGLTNKQNDPVTQRILTMVMSAQITSAPLSHGIHYYKAKFFPRMARAMLNIATGNRDISQVSVLDPFVGSGTTLLEAAQLGIRSTGMDIDPLSGLISQAKLGVLMVSSQELKQTIDNIQQAIETNINHGKIPPIVFPDWLMKNRKMTDDLAQHLIAEIDEIRHAIWQVEPPFADIVRVILSDAITRRIRFRFLGTGSGRFSLTLSKTRLKTLFLRSLETQLHHLVAWEWLSDTLGLTLAESTVKRGDARYLEDVSQFDVMVTSPPYLPASSGRESYAKARMPSLLALGIETGDGVDRLVDRAVGSMDDAIDSGYQPTDEVQELVAWLEQDTLRQIKAQPTERYFADMYATFASMKSHLKPSGKVILVSGRQSTFYRAKDRTVLRCVPVAEMLAEEAERAGLIVDQLVHIPLRKANRNARPRSLDDYDETLIFLSNKP